MDISGEIRELAERFLEKVRPSGPENVMAICPFHSEEDPSFAMNIINGVYFCHSCHAAGNLRSFLRGMGFDNARIERDYKLLIEEALKNTPKPPDPTRPGIYDGKEIDNALLGLFEYCPTKLLSDGFTESTLKHFEIGWDRWHNRMTFPIRDILGKLVGISGRNLTNDWPKYKVYDKEYRIWDVPERHGWNKSSVLYNAHIVYPTLRLLRPSGAFIVVVEGFKACMWLHQAGITNVVALLGSYMSYEQKWILEYLGVPVYIFLDNNDAGFLGTMQSCEELAKSLPAYVVQYPERLVEDTKAQPDSLTTEEIFEQVQAAPTYGSWLQTMYERAREPN